MLDDFMEPKENLEQEPTLENQEENPETPETPEEKLEEKKENDIDFEKELQELEKKPTQRTELEKAIFTRNQIDSRIKELGGNPPEAPVEPPTTEYVTRDDFAENLARGMVASDAELKVVMWQYRNGIKQTGHMKEDIENAVLLANKGRLKSTISELKRADGIKGSPSAGGGQRLPTLQIPKRTPEEIARLYRDGFSLNPATKTWQAKYMEEYFDPESKSWQARRIQK